jgi:hypothetical protein
MELKQAQPKATKKWISLAGATTLACEIAGTSWLGVFGWCVPVVPLCLWL